MIRGGLTLLGGAIGWYVGLPLGYFMALLLSSVGAGLGIFFARRIEEVKA